MPPWSRDSNQRICPPLPLPQRRAGQNLAPTRRAWYSTQRVKGISPTHPEQDARQAAYQAKDDGLQEELEPHIPRTRPQRLPQANLPCPFSDADEHDIHDTDAAYYQRDSSHPAQQAPKGFCRGCFSLDDAILGQQRKTQHIRTHIMSLIQQVGNLRHHAGDLVPVLRRNPDKVHSILAKAGVGKGMKVAEERDVHPAVIIVAAPFSSMTPTTVNWVEPIRIF